MSKLKLKLKHVLELKVTKTYNQKLSNSSNSDATRKTWPHQIHEKKLSNLQ